MSEETNKYELLSVTPVSLDGPLYWRVVRYVEQTPDEVRISVEAISAIGWARTTMVYGPNPQHCTVVGVIHDFEHGFTVAEDSEDVIATIPPTTSNEAVFEFVAKFYGKPCVAVER